MRGAVSTGRPINRTVVKKGISGATTASMGVYLFFSRKIVVRVQGRPMMLFVYLKRAHQLSRTHGCPNCMRFITCCSCKLLSIAACRNQANSSASFFQSTFDTRCARRIRSCCGQMCWSFFRCSLSVGCTQAVVLVLPSHDCTHLL